LSIATFGIHIDCHTQLCMYKLLVKRRLYQISPWFIVADWGSDWHQKWTDLLDHIRELNCAQSAVLYRVGLISIDHMQGSGKSCYQLGSVLWIIYK